MKQILIIPDINNIEETQKLAQEYNLGFEYNDFFSPDVLDDTDRLVAICKSYKQQSLPEYTTLHGAFFDVIPFSLDKRIKEVSLQRIHESIDVARMMRARAVVFHTNYNPFLNSPAYVDSFIKENIRIWDELLKANPDINIYLENMFDTTPDILLKLAESLQANPNFGVCLDYGHAALSKVVPYEWAKVLGQYVKHIHLNDNDLVSDLHLAWGDGKIDRAAFYQAYNTYMNGATVLVETRDISHLPNHYH